MTLGFNHILLTRPADEAWKFIFENLWTSFKKPIVPENLTAEVMKRDRNVSNIDLLLSSAAWDLWSQYLTSVPRTSQELIKFWNTTPGGKAVIILDGLSLREVPWILEQAEKRGYCVNRSLATGAEIPPDTTSFAKALGFNQRSSLENNEAGNSHFLQGANTQSLYLNWRDCIGLVGNDPNVVLWHHWPDQRVHDLDGPGLGLVRLSQEIFEGLTSDDFWGLVEKLTNGRTLVITSDHGYAASGIFPDVTDKEQLDYLKNTYKSGRFVSGGRSKKQWIPPIDIDLETGNRAYSFVLGRRKWKNAGGYPTLTHGGLSLLEVVVPYIELVR